jgi:hypothetical protein
MTIRSAAMLAALAAASVLSAGSAARAETLTFNCVPGSPSDGASVRVRVDTATGALTYYPYEESPTKPEDQTGHATATVSDAVISWRGGPPLINDTTEFSLDRRTGELIVTDRDNRGSGRHVDDRWTCKSAAAARPKTGAK